MGVMASSTFAASVYITKSGDWTDSTVWSTGSVPVNSSSDELKLCSQSTSTSGDGMTVTISTNVGNYNSGSLKIETVRDTTLKITGGYVGNNKEVVIGKADASSNGTDNGYLVQTGGTLDITGSGKLEIGYKALSVGTVGGLYTISDGNLMGTTGKMYIGCAGGTGSVGKINVVGTNPYISLGGEMYVANDSSTSNGNTGTGTSGHILPGTGAMAGINHHR